MRISDWSSDVCSSDLHRRASRYFAETGDLLEAIEHAHLSRDQAFLAGQLESLSEDIIYSGFLYRLDELGSALPWKLLSRHPMLLLELAWRRTRRRSEEPTSELQSLMRISYDVYCLKTK